MEAIAKTKNLKGSPRKARLVIDLIRGRNVSQALAILKFTDKRAAEPIEKVIDTTGAGDAFAAGFISAHLEGLPVDACLDRGVVSASFAIEALGAASLLEATRSDADARIRRFSAAGAGA